MTHNSDYVDAGVKWANDSSMEPVPLDAVLLGDLAGFWIGNDITDEIQLHHETCGWFHAPAFDGLCRSFLANIVEAALQHECPKADS